MSLDFTLELTRVPDTPELPVDIGWRCFAACKEANPEIFFLPETVHEAKKYCDSCPVMDICLSFANSLDEQGLRIGPYGIWGGLTASERQAMRQNRRKLLWCL